MITLITKKVSIDGFWGATDVVWTLFVDETFINDEQNVCLENMALPCILNKTAVAFSTKQ